MTGIGVFSQNLIGYNYWEIKKYMIEHHKDMNYNNVTNNRFRYLKYSSSSDSQTLLFFLNTDSVCQSMRLICDQSTIPEKIKEFNSSYSKSGDNRWIDNRNGKNYLIVLREEEWSYIVTIEPDK